MPHRLGERLRKYDWTGSVVELLIVVIGVYLGIQASNWNDGRKEAAEARYYAQRIVSELDESIVQLDDEIRAGEQAVESTQRLAELVRTGTASKVDRTQLEHDLFNMNTLPEVFIVNSAIEELQNAGRFGIFGNRSIQAALSRYQSKVRSAQLQNGFSLSGYGESLQVVYREFDAAWDRPGGRMIPLHPESLDGNVVIARALFTMNAFQSVLVRRLVNLRDDTRALRELVTREAAL